MEVFVAAEISAVVAIFAALISTIQISAMRWSSRSEVLSTAMQSHWSPANVANRQAVLMLKEKPYAEWSDDEVAIASSVALEIAKVGLLVKGSYVDRKAFLGFWSRSCLEFCHILVPLIADQRRRSGLLDSIHFEWLARQSALYLGRRPWWESESWLRLKRRTDSLPDPSSI